jgi:signal peptidase
MQHSGEQFLAGQQFPAGGAGSDAACAAMKQELLLQVLRDYGRVRIRALGTSMLPALWPGDVLGIERTDGGEICGGDVVLFERRGQLFAHRVVAAWGFGQRRMVCTQGDSIAHTDMPFRASEVLGRVEVVVRAGREIPLGLGAFNLTASWLFRQSGLLRRVSLALHSRYRRLAACKATGDARPESGIQAIYGQVIH